MTDTPFPGTTLLPVLRPQVWDAGKGALRVPLIRTKEELQNNPWVSFAYSTDDKLYTVTRESLKAHSQKGSDLVLEALKNLQALDFEWEIASRRADGSAMVLTCTHEYACESVLLPEHLTEAQSILGCHEVALAIPVAGHLIAQSAHPADRAELRECGRHEQVPQALVAGTLFELFDQRQRRKAFVSAVELPGVFVFMGINVPLHELRQARQQLV